MLLTGLREGKTSPVAYLHSYGKGKVFYTTLGHDERIFRNPELQKLIFYATNILLAGGRKRL